jgi:hypothetical protein
MNPLSGSDSSWRKITRKQSKIKSLNIERHRNIERLNKTGLKTNGKKKRFKSRSTGHLTTAEVI